MGKYGNFDYRYNGQISVDNKHQIIVGQHVSQNANDKKEVKPAIESIKETTGRLPKKMSLDNGYESGDNLEALKQFNIEAYLAISRGEKKHNEILKDSERPLVKADFKYDKKNDCFICPNGQSMPLKMKKKNDKCIYQSSNKICMSCQYKDRCCKSKKGTARTITTDSKEPLRQEMRERMAKEESKKIYKQRKTIVEPVFGHIKNGGFLGFSLRGKNKVAGEFSLVCAAHNIKKIVKAAMTGLISPLFGRKVSQLV